MKTKKTLIAADRFRRLVAEARQLRANRGAFRLWAERGSKTLEQQLEFELPIERTRHRFTRR